MTPLQRAARDELLIVRLLLKRDAEDKQVKQPKKTTDVNTKTLI